MAFPWLAVSSSVAHGGMIGKALGCGSRMQPEDIQRATMSSAVRDNPARSRFELDVDGEIAIANYRIDGNVITISHTETPPHLRGRGIASRLMQGVIDIVRARGLKVVPRCAFASDYFAKHPELSDLLA
jgi:uncharacterized protein